MAKGEVDDRLLKREGGGISRTSSARHYNIAVVGPGAIGGHVAAQLVQAGHNVSLIGRNGSKSGYLDKIKAEGLHIHYPGAEGELRIEPGEGGERKFSRITDNIETIQENSQDFVFVVTKAFDRTAQDMQSYYSLVRPGGAVIQISNGIQEWLAESLGALHDSHIEAVDPGGRIVGLIREQRALGKHMIGAVANIANDMGGDGKIHVQRSKDKSSLIVGSPYSSMPELERQVRELLIGAGFNSPNPAYHIAADLLVKAQVNIAINALSALIDAPIGEVLKEGEPTHAVALMLAEEASTVAHALGVEVRTPEELLERLVPSKDHYASMCADFKKPHVTKVKTEVGAIYDAIDEIWGTVNTGIPEPLIAINAVATLVKMKEAVATIENVYRDAAGNEEELDKDVALTALQKMRTLFGGVIRFEEGDKDAVNSLITRINLGEVYCYSVDDSRTGEERAQLSFLESFGSLTEMWNKAILTQVQALPRTISTRKSSFGEKDGEEDMKKTSQKKSDIGGSSGYEELIRVRAERDLLTRIITGEISVDGLRPNVERSRPIAIEQKTPFKGGRPGSSDSKTSKDTDDTESVSSNGSSVAGSPNRDNEGIDLLMQSRLSEPKQSEPITIGHASYVFSYKSGGDGKVRLYMESSDPIAADGVMVREASSTRLIRVREALEHLAAEIGNTNTRVHYRTGYISFENTEKVSQWLAERNIQPQTRQLSK